MQTKEPCKKTIRTNISCMNNKCKNYWEDMCLREWRENEVMHHDEDSKCMHFKEGKNEAYLLEEEQDAENF